MASQPTVPSATRADGETAAGPTLGGLVSYGASLTALAHRSAYYVDKILRGAKPADLPIEGPTVFEFVINPRQLQALGLTVSPSATQQVTEWLS